MPICLQSAGIISFMEVTLLQKVDKVIPAWNNIIFGHLVAPCHNNNHNVTHTMLNCKHWCVPRHFEGSFVKFGDIWALKRFLSAVISDCQARVTQQKQRSISSLTAAQGLQTVQYCKQVFPFSGLCVFSEHKSSLISAAAGRHHLSERALHSASVLTLIVI